MEKSSLKTEAIKLLIRSRENLLEMKLLLERNLYLGTVNRGYYAIFHAISALILFLEGKEFSSHTALISYFGKYYAKTEKIPKNYHKIFLDAFNIRQRADYDYDAIVSKEQADEIAINAQEIVNYVENKLLAQ